MKATLFLVAPFVAMSLATASHAAEEVVPWADVPAAAQKTITANAGGGTVGKIEKETKGKATFETKVKKPDGTSIDIKTDEDGELIAVEEEIPWAKVPVAVQKSITDNARGEAVKTVEKQTRGGKTTYETKVRKPGGTEIEIDVGEDGKLIKVEVEEIIPWRRVPAAVQKTITANAEGGRVRTVGKETKDGTATYEAEVKKSDGTRLDIEVGETGNLIEVEVEIPWAKVPAMIQKTITDNAAGGTVRKIEKETKSGKTIYEAKVRKWTDVDMEVAEDASLIELAVEEEIPWPNVPAKVRKVITDNTGGGTVETVEKEIKFGKTTYEAKVKKPDGVEVEIKVDEDGKLIEVE